MNKNYGTGQPDANDAQEKRRSIRWLLSGALTVGLLAGMVLATPAAMPAASVAISISVGVAPPPIPVYTQPPCPAPGYIWTPGYWAYDPAHGYYWVPGTWVMAPTPGFLWTPGYWGWSGVAFVWHAGYWGPHVGFYGGIHYGFGYPGVGFLGGEWRGGVFFYNRSVNNFGPGAHFDHVYYRSVPNNFAVNRVSYNGGVGGLTARPTPGELASARDRHIEATALQRQHEMAAHNDRGQFASVNHGRPEVAATGRPGDFRGAGVVRASRAGGAFEGERGANPGRAGGYAGARSPNPGGGGTHQVMTAHPNSPYSHSSGSRQAETRQYHSASSSHNEGSRGGQASREGAPREGQSRERSSRPSEGSRNEEHGGEPHH